MREKRFPMKFLNIEAFKQLNNLKTTLSVRLKDNNLYYN